MGSNQARNERRKRERSAFPIHVRLARLTGVPGRGWESEGGDKREGEGEDTYRMISGGSCCQDLLDSLPLYWEVGGDIRAVYASVARAVTLMRRR